MGDALLRKLASPSARLWTVVIAIALVSPALGAGAVLDDNLHTLMLEAGEGEPIKRAPWDLYSFFPTQEAIEVAMERGTLPWYASRTLRASFWRPVSSMSIAADRWLSPNPVVWHLQNLLWFAALIVLAGSLYRKLGPSPAAAGLATLVFAFDDAHGMAVGWIANRNAVVAMVFAVAALLFHIRWRRERWWPGIPLSAAALVLGLLSSEMALTATAYVLAYALFLDEGSRRSRVLSLLPLGLVLLAWRTAYSTLGYGAHGSGHYIDPLGEPMRFAWAAAERLPVLLGAQFGLVPAEFHGINIEGLRAGVVGISVVTLGLVGAVAAPLVWRNPRARFWGTAMVLSAIPMCATLPANRLLLPVGVAGAALVAELLMDVWSASAPPLRLRALATFLIGVHLVLAPLLLPIAAVEIALIAAPFEDGARSMDRAGPICDKTLVLVNPPDYFFGPYTGMQRKASGLCTPARFRTLASTNEAVDVARVDASTLRLSSQHGFVKNLFDVLLRYPGSRFEVGEEVARDDLTIRVAEVNNEGRPTAIVARFAVPLEDSSLVFAAWTHDGYMPLAIPALGETVRLSGVEIPEAAAFRYDPTVERHPAGVRIRP